MVEGLSVTDIVWDSNTFVLDIKDVCESVIGPPQFIDKIPRVSKSLIDTKQYKKYMDLMEMVPGIKNWDKWTRLVNPYDKVQYMAKTKNTRDYYIFYEIFKYIGINEKHIDSMHIGESSLHASKALTNFTGELNWTSCLEPTLSDHNRSSQTDFSKLLEEECKNSLGDSSKRIIYTDNTLSLEENMEELVNSSEKVDIITCDCNEDTSFDPLNNEQLIFRRLFVYIYTCLRLQKDNGTSIIKIYDTNTRPTGQLLYYMTKFYESVSIIKPRTSRYTNSKKIVVMKNFLGTSEEDIEFMDKTIKQWDKDKYVRIFDFEVPDKFEEQLGDYNKNLLNVKLTYMEKIIKYNSHDTIPERQLEAFQNKIAQTFCDMFKIPIDIAVTKCSHENNKKLNIFKMNNLKVCEECYCFFL